MGINKIAILYKADPKANPAELLPEHEEAIRKTAPDVPVVRAYEETELIATAADADVLLTWGLYSPHQYVALAHKLQWVHVLSAGFDGLIKVPEISMRRLIVTSTRGTQGIAIAEHTICMMLMFSRGFNFLRDRQLRKEWRRQLGVDELEGKTVGIVGVGEIGRVVARKCKALGMRVVGNRNRPQQDPNIDHLYAVHELSQLLAESDFVVVTVPLTPSTYHLMGQQQFRGMKRTAYFINVARGKVVDESALTTALKEGWIAGAGLDCFEVEPMSPSSELWDMPNVIVSPHMSGGSPYYMDRAVGVFCDNLRRFSEGKDLLYQLNWDTGF